VIDHQRDASVWRGGLQRRREGAGRLEVEIPEAGLEAGVVLVDRGPVGYPRRMMAAVRTGWERRSQKARMDSLEEAAGYQVEVEVVPATAGLAARTVREQGRTGSMVEVQHMATDHEEWSSVVEDGSPAEEVVALTARLGYRHSLQLKTVGSAAGKTEGVLLMARSRERELVPSVEAVEG
jgi:hypothetical protein